MMEKERLDRITESIIGAAIEVHRALGPGLLESAYEACLAFELAQRGLRVKQQKPLPVIYREVKLDCGYRLDFLIEERVIVEVRAVDRLAPIHQAQLSEAFWLFSTGHFSRKLDSGCPPLKCCCYADDSLSPIWGMKARPLRSEAQG